MAVSADGYLAKGPNDDMSWTGREDKTVFRLLTNVGGVCAAGSKTCAAISPSRFAESKILPGRKLIRLSTDGGMLLETLAAEYPDAWLLGGPTIAREALGRGYVEEVHLCVNMEILGDGMHAEDYLWHHVTEETFPLVSSIDMFGGLVNVQTRRKRRRG